MTEHPSTSPQPHGSAAESMPQSAPQGPPPGTPQGPPPGAPYGAPQAAPQVPPYGGPSVATALTPENEKQIGALAHGLTAVIMVVSGGLLGFVAALVIYLMFRDRGPFVRAQTANALNVQIVTGIALAISVVLMFVLVGFLTYPLIWLAGVVLHVIGTVKALNGEWWTPPLTPQFVR